MVGIVYALVAMWVGEFDICGLRFPAMGTRQSLEPDDSRHPVRMGAIGVV